MEGKGCRRSGGYRERDEEIVRLEGVGSRSSSGAKGQSQNTWVSRRRPQDAHEQHAVQYTTCHIL